MATALQPNSVYAYTNLDEVQVFLSTANLTDRGDWSSATAYAVGNVITYLDALYFCVASNTNEAPSGNLSDYWSSLVLVRSGSGSNSVTAQEAYDLAEDAYTLATNGTTSIQIVRDGLDAEIQARLHGDGTTYWNGTDYAYSLFVAGTNDTNRVTGGGGAAHVIAGQNGAVTDVGAGTRSVAVNRITTNTVDWVGPSVGAMGNVAYAGTVSLDFGSHAYTTIQLTGDVHLQFSNISRGRGISCRIIGDTSDRALTIQGGVRMLGTYPDAVTANKVAVASFCAYGANTSDIVGAFAEEA